MLIFRCFPVQTVNLIFYGVLQAGGGVHPQSVTSSAAMSKPSSGIRSLLSLSACGLPTPVVALACIGNVDIQVFFLVQVGDFISYGVCKFVFLGSPLGHPKGVPCAELSPQVTEGLPATAANRFHKELRFFFSLLKRKKEAKKEKSSRFTCTIRQCITRRLHKKLFPIDSHQQNFPGGANRRLPPP